MDEVTELKNMETPPETLVKDFSSQEAKKSLPLAKIFIGIIVILLGTGTGYVISQKSSLSLSNESGKSDTPKVIQTNKIVGSTDVKTFRDSAVGVIQKNGIDGEGTHKLIREGGESQTAYLTSSIVDLDLFVGKKVKVWGETFRGQKAAWLMDVGKIEILE